MLGVYFRVSKGWGNDGLLLETSPTPTHSSGMLGYFYPPWPSLQFLLVSPTERHTRDEVLNCRLLVVVGLVLSIAGPSVAELIWYQFLPTLSSC